MDKEFFEAVNALQKERNISADAIYEKIANALVIAAGHNFGTKDGIFCDINPEEYEVRLYMRKTVVPTEDDVMDPAIEISVDEAQHYKSGAVTDDVVEIPLEINDFGRIAAQTAKQVIIQGIREAERGMIFESFSSKEHEILTGTVLRIDNSGDITVRIGQGTDRTDVYVSAAYQDIPEGTEVDKGTTITVEFTTGGTSD